MRVGTAATAVAVVGVAVPFVLGFLYWRSGWHGVEHTSADPLTTAIFGRRGEGRADEDGGRQRAGGGALDAVPAGPPVQKGQDEGDRDTHPTDPRRSGSRPQ